MENRVKLIKLFEAIESDDFLPVRRILKNNISANSKIPSKQLCGLAIIAAENNAVKVAKEFYKYNLLANDNNLSKYLTIARKIFEEKSRKHKIVHSSMLH